ncbi:MAG TPA: transcriptional repressor LexA [Candidatus Ratteibacteria bacterium]|nr:transcriptional repressor LexA [Candidatus Ratteibacteria bacterium]
MKKLTERQREILKFIKNFTEKNGYPPTIEEIMRKFSFSSPNAVITHLSALKKKGVIERKENISRGIIIKETDKIYDIPIVGNIPAGIPLEEEENIEGYLTISENLLSRDEYFALRVKGESMKDAGIFDGDYVILKKDNEIKNGDIVVAYLDNQYTVKYFYKKDSSIELRPANKLYTSIKVNKNQKFQIIGKVKGVFRKIL